MRQVKSVVGRHGIRDEESLGFLLPELLANKVVGRPESQLTTTRVVSVACDNMDQTIRDPTPGFLLSSWAKDSGERARRDLRKATKAQPICEPLGVRAQDRIAFRVSDNGPQAQKLNFMKGLVHNRRNGILAELNEQIILLIDTES